MGEVVLENIEKWYDQTLACTNINLRIRDGQFFTFLGPSGCGKTTILRLISALLAGEEERDGRLCFSLRQANKTLYFKESGNLHRCNTNSCAD